MPIPGLKARLEVRAKVRLGEKRAMSSGGTRPAATDYFLSDDAEFQRLCGDKPKSIRIQFPHSTPEDNFASGMEWWRGKQLTCYSKGETVDGQIKAYRVIAVLDPEDEKHKMGAPMGRNNERQPIACAFRDCKHFGRNAANKECRVMGRLVFFLDGGRTDSVLEVDTKSWNSIEQLEGALAGLARTAPLNARGRVFELSVEMRQKGRDKFPVLNVTEATDVKVDTDQKIDLADALLNLDRAYRQHKESPDEVGEPIVKRHFGAALDVSHPAWRDKPELIEKIRAHGVVASVESYLQKQLDKWTPA